MAGFNTAVTGLKSASQMLDVAGNNIANSSTVGFKSSRTEFADIYATSVVGAGASNQPGSGVTVSDISQDFSAGTIEFTNNNLDLAINGSGFFQLNDGNGGVTYTRAGAFELDKDGSIVSKNGKHLQGYGLDALGNQLPLQDLAVTQKESAPKATETIDLSFNIDSSLDPTELSRFFDKSDPGSYSYSTTVETLDSLGNSNSIRFYVVEQRPVREVYSYDVSELTDPNEAGTAGIADITALVNDFSDADTPAVLTDGATDLTELQFDFNTNNSSFDVAITTTAGATVTAQVDLTTDWDNGGTPTAVGDIANELAQLINDALNTEAGTSGLSYVSVDSASGDITLNSTLGTSISATNIVDADAGNAPLATFLGAGTSGDLIAGGATFSFDVFDNAGDPIYAQPFTITLSENWSAVDSGTPAGLQTLADGLADAINSAIRSQLGTTNTDYVTVDTAGNITLVADEWVNSGSTFSISDFAGTDSTVATTAIGVITTTDVTVGTPENLLISGVEFTFEEMLNLPTSLIQDPVKLANFRATDPRIDPESLSYNAQTGVLEFETFAYATQSGDMVVSGRGEPDGNGGFINATELTLVGGNTTERDANKVETFDLRDTAFPQDSVTGIFATTSSFTMSVGGIDIPIGEGLTKASVGQIFEDAERTLIERNPDLESVVYDSSTEQVVFTWKADAGNVDNLSVVSIGNSVFESNVPEITKGDNSYRAQYRMFGFLNDTESLNLGKVVDPGESGFDNGLTEVGPILVSFDSTTGALASVNGVEAAGSAPRISIRGADPANPNDELLDSDIDGLEGIQLDITGTTQFASESIVKASSQDGYPKGDLIGVTFAETGEMVASFSNGQRQNLGLVAIASFENQAGLSSAGSTEWIATLASGAAILNPPGTGLNGTLRSAALESSNVDLSAELVKLIEAQRNFQANSKTLETQNTVTQAILQI